MTSPRIALIVGASLSLFLCRGGAMAQQQGARTTPATLVPGQPRPPAAGETLQSINDEYNRQLLQIEQQRLDRLVRLAASQPPREASETYELLFRLAIAHNLFAHAEPAADRVLKSANTAAPVVRFLAETVNVIAEADRGAYDESLADLRRLMGAGAQDGQPVPANVLDTPALLTIFGAYYQRLVQSERFDVARKAFQLLAQESPNPEVKDYSTHRLRQLDLIGKAAPPIQGMDIDGNPFDLASLKGDVVLVIFWASWCQPNSAEIAWFDEVYATNRDRGFRIVGINVDTLQNGGTKVETVMPGIRRFLLDHNVRWPNLVNGEGPHDHAAAYGVTEIPTNVLIGRDGTVIQVDLSRKNLSNVVARSVGRQQ